MTTNNGTEIVNTVKAAIEAMDAIMGAMREEREDADTLTLIERAVQRYVGQRWAITRETGK